MRLRFFTIILTALTLLTAGIIVVHALFFRTQRMVLLDAEIRDSATILVNSELSSLKRANFARVDRIISHELGESRIGKFFIVRDNKDQVVFAAADQDLLKMAIPRTPDWVTIHTAHHILRVLNLDLPALPDRTLQVGSIVDADFFDWVIANRQMNIYIAEIFAVVLIASMLLTQVLLSPLRALSKHLSAATSDLKNLKDVRQLPPHLAQYPKQFWARTDEFSKLLETIQRLIERINTNYRLTRIWTFQMAHELKTPLTIIRSEIESLATQAKIPADSALAVTNEVDEIASLVTHFLDWADLENSGAQKDLHAVRVGKMVEDTCKRLGRIYPGRLEVEILNDTLVLANPMHVEQVINNLIVNGLEYSPTDQLVLVKVDQHSLTVRDRGEGIPHEVLSRLGQPFNIGNRHSRRKRKGSGLGLAWVNTVSKMYAWNLEIKSHPHPAPSVGARAPQSFGARAPQNSGTEIRIGFPLVEAEDQMIP